MSSAPRYLSPITSGPVSTGLSQQHGSCDDHDDKPGKNLDSRLLESRTITLFGAVEPKLTNRVITALHVLDYDDPKAPITLLQNSPGGSVSDGLAIYDTIRFITAPVRILCVGLTASIATITLLGADKNDRLALKNTRFLIHQPLIAGGVFGPASDLEITAQEIIKSRDRINRMLAEATGQPLERVERDTQRDYWMSAEAALEYGLIGRIVSSRAEVDAD